MAHEPPRTATRPVPRHLLTPDDPRRHTDQESLTRVQRWVISTLVVSTALHLVVGLILFAGAADKPDARIGLLLISAVIGVLSMAGARLIHATSVLSVWLLPGLLPSAIGAYVILGR